MTTTTSSTRLEMEVCRAMFERDPDRLLELVSEWLETNRMTPEDDFCVPPYLEQILAGAQRSVGHRTSWRAMVC